MNLNFPSARGRARRSLFGFVIRLPFDETVLTAVVEFAFGLVFLPALETSFLAVTEKALVIFVSWLLHYRPPFLLLGPAPLYKASHPITASRSAATQAITLALLVRLLPAECP
jgi:hypothetical protein